MSGQPFSKEQQLARAERRYKRRVASPKTWQRIADEKQGPCRTCGAVPPNELHHLVPRSQGGSDVADNIVPLCSDCHGRVEARNKEVCAALRLALSDAEYAYAATELGDDRFEARFPVKWEAA